MNRTVAHQKLVNDILFAFGSRPDVRIWKRVVGFDLVKKIKYGIVGETDLQGIVLPNGRYLAIECKTGNAVLSKPQIKWRDMIIKFGGIYILAKSLNQALTDFEAQL